MSATQVESSLYVTHKTAFNILGAISVCHLLNDMLSLAAALDLPFVERFLSS